MRTAADPQSSGLYERRCGRDYPGILTTEVKRRGVGYIQNIITQFKVKLTEAKVLYLTVYDDDDNNNNNVQR